MFGESITDWSQLEELDNYPELERISAEVSVKTAAEFPSELPRELTELWDKEVRADAMNGVI